MGMRGEINYKSFSTQVALRKYEKKIKNLARHKDFPLELKEIFYKNSLDESFLPQEAQIIFTFN